MATSDEAAKAIDSLRLVDVRAKFNNNRKPAATIPSPPSITDFLPRILIFSH